MGKAQKGYARSERIAEQIQRLLAERLSKGLKDPRVGWVTITAVNVSRDYSYATVYYTVMDESTRDETQQALLRASGYLRSELMRSLQIFTTPQLKFVYDESVERGLFIGRLIDQAVSDDVARACEAEDAIVPLEQQPSDKTA